LREVVPLAGGGLGHESEGGGRQGRHGHRHWVHVVEFPVDGSPSWGHHWHGRIRGCRQLVVVMGCGQLLLSLGKWQGGIRMR
jgi:hypothetical protein